MSEFKEFWVYSNEEYAPTYACDFNQRGFVPSRNRESIHVIEYAALEQANAKNRELQLQLADRTEKYHLFIESGLDQKCREAKELESKLAIAVEAFCRIRNVTAYAGTPTKETLDYLIKQAGIKCPEIAKEALEKLRGE